MRTRSKDETVVGSTPGLRVCKSQNPSSPWFSEFGIAFYPGEHTTYFQSGQGSTKGTYGSITDEASGHNVYNDVSHTKGVWDCPSRTFVCEGSGVVYGVYPWSTKLYGTSACPTTKMQFLASTYPIYWDSDYVAKGRAIAKMQWGVQDAGISLPTFLGELRDFRDLYNLVGKKILDPDLFFKAANRKVPFLQRFRKNWSISDVFKWYASADLANEFAIKPLINDLMGFNKLSEHIQAQYKRIYGGDPVRVRGTHVDHGSDSLSWPPNGDDDVTLTCEYVRETTAWAMIKFDLDQLPKPYDNAVRFDADALGFDNLASTAWELVPWSFLVDYFIGMGDWLRQFETEFNEFPFEILQQGTSVKKTSTVTGKLEPLARRSSGALVSDRKPAIYGEFVYTDYQRKRTVLGEILPPLFPSLSLPINRQVRNIVNIFFLKIFKTGS